MEGHAYEDIPGVNSERGGFASVRQVKRTSDSKIVACKMLKYAEWKYGTKENFRERVHKEMSLLSRLEHPNIVRYFDMAWEGDIAKIYMEWCEGETLEKYVKDQYNYTGWPSERLTWNMIYQTSAALSYCHSGLTRNQNGSMSREETDKNGNPWIPILHRDIKPANILVRYQPSGQAVFKLCDFGLGFDWTPGTDIQASFAGTAPFIPPEVTQDNREWSNKTDVFALGCVFFFFFDRRLPYANGLSTTSPDASAAVPTKASGLFSRLISDCISPKASQRPEAEKIFRQSLNHVDPEDLQLSSAKTYDTMPSVDGLRMNLKVPVSDFKNNDDRFVHNYYIETQPNPSNVPSTLRQTLQSFYAPKIDRSSGQMAPSVAHLAVPGGSDTFHSSPGAIPSAGYASQSPVSADPPRDDGIGGFSREEMEHKALVGLGNLVVDYKVKRPIDMYQRSSVSPHSGGWSSEVISTGIQFRSVYTPGDPSKKPSRFSFKRDRVTEVEVMLEADSCVEVLLENPEEELGHLGELGECYPWLKRKVNDQKKEIFMIVGYLAYENAVVEEQASPGARSSFFSRSFGVSASSPIAEVGASAGNAIAGSASSSNSLSKSHPKRYQKRRYNIQAVMVRPVQSPLGTPSLGDITTAYFWGPRERPE